VRRGIGFCNNSACYDMFKGVFLLNHGTSFVCPRCRVEGHLANETGHTSGPEGTLYKEVLVEYGYRAETRTYRAVAIVRDDAVQGEGRVYTLRSPFILTDKRALGVAERLLGSVRAKEPGAEVPSNDECELDFDAQDFYAKLSRFEDERLSLAEPR
jgi:hypothetical protein